MLAKTALAYFVNFAVKSCFEDIARPYDQLSWLRSSAAVQRVCATERLM
jgi:hypothetical protein